MKAGRLVFALLLFVNVAVAQQPNSTNASNAAAAGVGNQSRGEIQPNTARAIEEFWPVTLNAWIEIIQGISVTAASIAAFFGIKAWHKEYIGKRRLELAEEALALFYQAVDVIAWMRFPGRLTEESSLRKPEAVETPKQKQIRDDAYVTFERYNLNREIFSRIQALRYGFMAQFGKDAASPFGRLKSILDELFSAARQWVMLSEVDERTFSNPLSLQEHQARIEKFEETLWGMEEGDRISPLLEDVVREVERICRPQLDGKS